MNKKYLVTLLFFFSTLYGEEVYIEELGFNLYIADDFVEDPGYVLQASSFNELKKISKLIEEFESENMFTYKIESYSVEDIINHFQNGAFNTGFVNVQNKGDDVILDYISRPGTYKVFARDYGSSDDLYSKLVIEDKVFGEMYFQYSYENYLYPSDLQFTVVFLSDKVLYRIFYRLNDPEMSIAPKLPNLFYQQGDNWYFANKELDFYEQLTSGELRHVSEYDRFISGWNSLLDSIKLGLKERELANSNSKTFGILNSSRVRVRSEPNLDGNHLGYLNDKQTVEILDETNEEMRIDNMCSTWLKIKTDDGLVGWTYGHFIDFE